MKKEDKITEPELTNTVNEIKFADPIESWEVDISIPVDSFELRAFLRYMFNEVFTFNMPQVDIDKLKKYTTVIKGKKMEFASFA